MSKLLSVFWREFRAALPAVLFFFCLFHLLALTQAVVLGEYNLAALRAVSATVGALLVAKAILVVEALPWVRRSGGTLLAQVVWKTALYSVMVILFKLIEDLVPLAWARGSLGGAFAELFERLRRPISWVLSVWAVAGLALYTIIRELTRAMGRDTIRALLRSDVRGSES